MRRHLRNTTIWLAVTGSMFAAMSANAETVSNTAKVKILNPIALTANDDMDFGKVFKPSGSPVDVILSSSGALSGSAVVPGSTGAAGTVSIVGDAANTVSVTVTDTTAETGLSLSNFNGTVGDGTVTNGSATGITLTGGSSTLTLGATLRVSSTVASGDLTPSYEVEVVYE